MRAGRSEAVCVVRLTTRARPAATRPRPAATRTPPAATRARPAATQPRPAAPADAAGGPAAPAGSHAAPAGSHADAADDRADAAGFRAEGFWFRWLRVCWGWVFWSLSGSSSVFSWIGSRTGSPEAVRHRRSRALPAATAPEGGVEEWMPVTTTMRTTTDSSKSPPWRNWTRSAGIWMVTGVPAISGSGAYADAFPEPARGRGCISDRCLGYELTVGLDFDTNGNGVADAGDRYWNGGAGWEPIGKVTPVRGGVTGGRVPRHLRRRRARGCEPLHQPPDDRRGRPIRSGRRLDNVRCSRTIPRIGRRHPQCASRVGGGDRPGSGRRARRTEPGPALPHPGDGRGHRRGRGRRPGRLQRPRRAECRLRRRPRRRRPVHRRAGRR